jgi:hypothetical protein
VSTAVVLALTGYAIWKLVIVKRWVEDVEYEGNVDANDALENLPDLERKDEEEKEKAKKEEEEAKKKKEEEQKKGKGKKK